MAVAKGKKKAEDTATITVMQYGSPMRRDSRQREQLKTLGLGKMNRTKELLDSPSVRALVTRLSHMVKIVGE
jgi:large subunit ribosomal protein L30